jgi:hypothetical protein
MSRLCSIREFCDLETPIFMFDKDGAFVVMKLGQVRVPRASTWRLMLMVWTVTSSIFWPRGPGPLRVLSRRHVDPLEYVLYNGDLGAYLGW